MEYLCGLKPYGALPNKRQLEHLKLGKKAFLHFGMSTFTDSEWGTGTEESKQFNPHTVDCRQWVRSFKAAGFEIIIIAAKHHDGFCMWQSAYTEHCMKNSPYKDGNGDIIKEFCEACSEYGVKAGIYLSPWDRNAPGWGSDSYNDYYVNQLTELLTNYGEIYEIWWDGAGSANTPYDWGRWAYTIRELQPNAAIFGAMGAAPYVDFRWVGNEAGFAGDPCYATIDENIVLVEDTALLNNGMINGNRFIPAEVDVSSRPGWFYHKEQDDEVKSVENIIRMWYTSVGRGSIFLFNIPSNRDGVLPSKDVENTVKANEYITKMMSVNLAANGNATSAEDRCQCYEAQNILVNNDDCIFAAKDGVKNVTINITLPEEKTFNTFTISEKIELGIRVTGYKISAKIDGEWVLIKDKKSIGYLWAEYFDEITAKELKIEIYDFLAPPVIRHFGLHYLDIDPFAENKIEKDVKDLAKGSNAKVLYNEKDIEVMFGGIYPFNTVVLNKIGAYEYTIEAFDGFKYYEIHKGHLPQDKEIVRLDKTVEGSYQIRICIEGKHITDQMSVEVYNL